MTRCVKSRAIETTSQALRQQDNNALAMSSLDSFYKTYDTRTTKVVVKNRTFRFLTPSTIDRFVDPDDLFRNFPLWSKIWEASIVLGDFLAGMKPEPGKQILEIGCGLGVVGIIASSFGHRVTMTEYNADSLNFARANARLNALSPGSNPQIVALDWNRPQMDGLFDYVVGSEVIYKEKNYQPLVRLFTKYLRPGGEIILAEGIRKTSVEFFRKAERSYHLKAYQKTLRSDDKEIPVILCRMKPKDPPASEKSSSR